MKKEVFIVLFFLSICNFINAQNLIPHGHFEWGLYEEFEKPQWWLPTIGSTDTFIGAKSGKGNLGYQEPHSENRHIGIISYTENNKSYKEYIQTKLTKPLIKDSLYCAKMYISLADNSFIALSGLQIGFSKKKRTRTNKRYWNFELDRMDAIIDCNNLSFPYITDKENWIPISGVYKAMGKERFITIGYFEVPDTLKMYKPEQPKYPHSKKPKIKRHRNYYFIDDVSLVPIQDSSECICSSPELITPQKEISLIIEKADTVRQLLSTDTITPVYHNSRVNKNEVFLNNSTSFIFEQITFELNSDKLLAFSKSSLDSLVILLEEYSSLKLEIQGHTDDTGNPPHNFELSEKRAKTIYRYLISRGISSERLSYKGYGATQPISTNQTQKGRRKNRRVEFHVKEK